MSSDRIPCAQCAAMILPNTAQRNNGLCEPCETRRCSVARNVERAEWRRNPPKCQEEIDRIAPDTIENFGLRMFLSGLLPKRLNPENFTKKNFLEALQEMVEVNKSDGRKMSEEFLALCDPIIFNEDSLIKGIKKLPRPYREAMAVYQLWGMMCSDGITSYLENTDRKYDSEVDLGFRLFGKSHLSKFIERARNAHDPMEGIPDELEKEIEDLLFAELANFEVTLLAPFLSANLAKK
jgi:hypothetical protein